MRAGRMESWSPGTSVLRAWSSRCQRYWLGRGIRAISCSAGEAVLLPVAWSLLWCDIDEEMVEVKLLICKGRRMVVVGRARWRWKIPGSRMGSRRKTPTTGGRDVYLSLCSSL